MRLNSPTLQRETVGIIIPNCVMLRSWISKWQMVDLIMLGCVARLANDYPNYVIVRSIIMLGCVAVLAIIPNHVRFRSSISKW